MCQQMLKKVWGDPNLLRLLFNIGDTETSMLGIQFLFFLVRVGSNLLPLMYIDNDSFLQLVGQSWTGFSLSSFAYMLSI